MLVLQGSVDGAEGVDGAAEPFVVELGLGLGAGFPRAGG